MEVRKQKVMRECGARPRRPHWKRPNKWHIQRGYPGTGTHDQTPGEAVLNLESPRERQGRTDALAQHIGPELSRKRLEIGI